MMSFEALNEASVRDTECPETWAVLCLWHCRMRNDIVAKRSFQVLMERVMPDLDLLLEVGWAMLPVHVPFSFAAAPRALDSRRGPGAPTPRGGMGPGRKPGPRRAGDGDLDWNAVAGCGAPHSGREPREGNMRQSKGRSSPRVGAL